MKSSLLRRHLRVKLAIAYKPVFDVFCSCLQENVFDDSLELSGPIEHSSRTGSNGQSVELRPRGPAAGAKSTRSIRRQTWNREEVSLAV